MDFQHYAKYIIGPDVEDRYEKAASYKLEDMLVPIKDTIDHAMELECCEFFKLGYTYARLNDENKLETRDISESGVYAVDYSYLSPVNVDYLSIDKKDLTEVILADWIESINSRVMPIISNAVKLEHVRQFDENPNRGCFLHIYTGKIDTYEFDSVDDVITLYNDSELWNLLEYATMMEPNCMEYKNTVAGFLQLMANGENVLVTYDLKLKGPNHNGDDHLYNQFDVGIPEVLVRKWCEYILNMVRLRAKVIVIP